HFAAELEIEQPLGAGIGEDDFAELIDGDHGVDEPGQDFAELVPFGNDPANANFRRGPSHFQLLRAAGKVNQPLANSLTQLPPGVVLFAKGNRIERSLVVESVELQLAQAIDIATSRLRTLGRLNADDADGD